jgi:hypothetical protein
MSCWDARAPVASFHVQGVMHKRGGTDTIVREILRSQLKHSNPKTLTPIHSGNVAT